MRPLFTVHGGEYLVGSFIEEHYKKWNVWVPSKDTGIDLLVTDARNTRTVSLQVKFSKDFNPGRGNAITQNKIAASGWWALKEKKIRDSKADFWVFVLQSFTEHQTHFIIIPPRKLLQRFRATCTKSAKTLHSYLCVTKSGRCWDVRGLSRADQEMIAFDRFRHTARDFTLVLNNWSEIERRLKK
jgi:hypothetical protein